MCFDEYITTDNSVASKSGMYFTDLSGCTISLLDDISKEDHADYTETFNYLYKAAQRNLRVDLQLALANRFHIDKKLITRETSEFLTDYNTGSEAGVKIKVILPKYGRIQILSIGVDSEFDYQSPEAEFQIKDENGDILSNVSSQLQAGKNTIKVYQEFEVDELFISYDPSVLSLKKTKNLFYPNDLVINGWDKLACTFPCFWGSDGSVFHINGGGLNIKFILYCSIEKVICENLPLFGHALFYKLGVETMKERITTQRVNKTTVLTVERANELGELFEKDYTRALDAATKNIRMTEDTICFNCKRTIYSKTVLP